MKRVVFLLFVLVGCSYDYTIYVDNDLSTDGIDAWGHDVRYQEHVVGDIVAQPDCIVLHDPGIISCGFLGVSSGEVIKVAINNDILIAHEFGHFIGLVHVTDYKSVMYPRADLTRELEYFNEFR